MINSIAALKRYMQVGVEFRCLENVHGPCNEGRTVARVQGNRLWVRCEGKEGDRWWMPLDFKASQVTFSEDGFEVNYPAMGTVVRAKRLAYQYVTPTLESGERRHTGMTRANGKPVRRVVEIGGGELVAEIRADTLTLRPVRTRQGGPAEVSITWGAIYYRAMLDKTGKRKR